MICQWNKKKIKRNHFVSTDGRQYKNKSRSTVKQNYSSLKIILINKNPLDGTYDMKEENGFTSWI